MSLINQTLKELDKRRQSTAAGDQSIQATPGVVITQAPARSHFKVTAITAGILTIVGLVYWGALSKEPTPSNESLNNKATPTTTRPRANTPTTDTSPKKAAATPTPSVEPLSALTPDTRLSREAKKSELLANNNKSSAAVSKNVTPTQQAENLYRQAIASLRSNQEESARDQLRQALTLHPAHHDARLLLARALIDARQPTAARSVLQEGLALSPQRSSFYVTLAHSYIQFNETDQALATLQQGLPHAGNDAEYNALIAAIYQRKNRHEDAARHYLVALRQSPDTANWLVGLGISLQATNNTVAAAEAFQRALDLGGLPPALAATAQEQLKKLTRKP